MSWFVGCFKAGISEKYLFFLYKCWVFVSEDAFNIKFQIFFNKQFLISQTEGKRYHNTKEMFDSAYALSKKSSHQFRHIMLCSKVTNNAMNNYRSCQSLYDFIQLSLINTTKEQNEH